jgi:hypothetical protein
MRILSYSYFTMKKTIFIASLLAAATLLAAGLAMFPASVQQVFANPCSVQANGPGGVEVFNGGDVGDFDCDFEGVGELEIAEGND